MRREYQHNLACAVVCIASIACDNTYIRQLHGKPRKGSYDADGCCIKDENVSDRKAFSKSASDWVDLFCTKA